MKKSTAIIVIILVASVVSSLCGVLMNQLLNPANTYAMTCEVVELDRENDLVILVDANGFEWAWEGIEDWQIGDCASMLMDNNGTAEIFDDVILSMNYNAWELN
jgi:hypothetical protein